MKIELKNIAHGSGSENKIINKCKNCNEYLSVIYCYIEVKWA